MRTFVAIRGPVRRFAFLALILVCAVPAAAQPNASERLAQRVQVARGSLERASALLEDRQAALVAKEAHLNLSAGEALSSLSAFSAEQDELVFRFAGSDHFSEPISRDSIITIFLHVNADTDSIMHELAMYYTAVRTVLHERTQLAVAWIKMTRLNIAVLEASLPAERDSVQIDSLAEHIADLQLEISVALNDVVDVTINSFPRDGATVFFQTRRGRERRDQARRLPQMTNGRQSLYRGCYFIWAQWSDGTRTDPNRDECFDQQGMRLDLNE